MLPNINWTNISNAIEYYKSLGFEYVETPWYVNYSSIEITCPYPENIVTIDTNDESYYSVLKGLVGSAEQGFLQLAKDKKLPHVNYVSAGPCFRNEKFDEFHQPQFMKVELFSLCPDEKIAIAASKEMLLRAHKFMGKPDIVITDVGQDLELNGIEVGSYGARYHQDIGWWAYGTGVAEPRFSQALAAS